MSTILWSVTTWIEKYIRFLWSVTTWIRCCDLSLELTLAAPRFAVGDFVWLLRRNIATTRPCPKLNYKKLGPFRIIEKIGSMVVRLELPSHFRIHNVFYVSLLKLTISPESPIDSLLRHHQSNSQPEKNMKWSKFLTLVSSIANFNISLPSNSVNPSAEDRARLLKDLHRGLSLEVTLTRECYKEQVAPLFAVCDFFWLLRRNIATTRPCPKLNYKKLGPLRII